MGAIGLTIGEWLAREASARLLLTARAALPSRDAWDRWLAEHDTADATSERIHAIRRIEDAGGSVRIAVVDAADAPAMANAVADAEGEWGSVVGVVHAAGVPGEGIFAAATRESLSEALRAKVGGLNVLADLFGARRLDFVALLSSINAAVGTAGAGAYTAANAYLDAFANSTQAPADWHAVSIAYAAWSQIGMATKVVVPAAMRDARRALVAAGIPPRDGVEALARLLASGLHGAVVSPFDIEGALTERRRILRARRQAPAPAVADKASKAAFDGASFDADGIEAQLTAVWADLLGLDSIGPDENFFELGGHSLLATRVLARVFDAFGVQIPLRTLFEAPTVRQLAAIIASRVEPAAVAADGDREEIEL